LYQLQQLHQLQQRECHKSKSQKSATNGYFHPWHLSARGILAAATDLAEPTAATAAVDAIDAAYLTGLNR
jgi:hypothetical protein